MPDQYINVAKCSPFSNPLGFIEPWNLHREHID